MNKIAKAQKYLKKNQLDGWLLYDFKGSNPLALDFLGVGEGVHLSRRLFYWIPLKGEPVALVHQIEPYVLDHLPGSKITYQTWQQMRASIQEILSGVKTIAMEYSPSNFLPYISKVDAGTVEMVKEYGVKVVSSGPFLQEFTAVLSQDEHKLQQEAGVLLDQISKEAFSFLSECLRNKRDVNEYGLQRWVLKRFEECGLVTTHEPICAFGVHTADPHYSPGKETSAYLKPEELILLDFVAKKPGGIYGDITRMGFSGSHVPEEYQVVFSVARKAQDLGFELVKHRYVNKEPVYGYEVDGVCRGFIQEKGYGEYFTHRTGHNIDRTSLHGSGAHLDGFETYDDRPIVPGSCFTIEPGIYFPKKWGIRVEYDVIIRHDLELQITSGIQQSITACY